VVGYKKKIVMSLIVVVLGGVVPAVCSTQSPQAKPGKVSYNLYSPAHDDANRPGEPFNTSELFFKMMAAVLLVIALGVAAIYISKKFLPKITNLPGKKIYIVETVHLGPRKTVHLLKIGNQQLLIGITSESITALADVTDALTNSSSQEQETHNN